MAAEKLWSAAKGGNNADIVKALNGEFGFVSVNTKDRDEWTALLWASKNGHTATVDLLLNRGADIHAKNKNEFTALHWAAWNGHTATVELLLNCGADIHARNNDGETALHRAAWKGHTATVDLLLERGADIHHVARNGWTALHQAVADDHIATVDLLLNRGADINAKDAFQRTPVDLADPATRLLLLSPKTTGESFVRSDWSSLLRYILCVLHLLW